MNPRTLTPVFLVFAACAAPGVDIRPEASDFAVVEIQLEG
jgi:hypothetical protein